MHLLTFFLYFLCRGKLTLPPLRSNKKAAAGRTQPPTLRPSPAAAPGTPVTSRAETTAEKMAGKKQVADTSVLKMAEASASDASQIIAIKREAAAEMAASKSQASPRPRSEGGVQWKDPRKTLKDMRKSTHEWYKHMSGLHSTLDDEIEVRYSLVAAPGHFGG